MLSDSERLLLLPPVIIGGSSKKKGGGYCSHEHAALCPPPSEFMMVQLCQLAAAMAYHVTLATTENTAGAIQIQVLILLTEFPE